MCGWRPVWKFLVGASMVWRVLVVVVWDVTWNVFVLLPLSRSLSCTVSSRVTVGRRHKEGKLFAGKSPTEEEDFCSESKWTCVQACRHLFIPSSPSSGEHF
ncbi:hypothetical protein QBC39DRAFT_338003 [Podospora conica]|nr:hypothetical protein QBC39DRAFT_338003 [Schizothecium conicum]